MGILNLSILFPVFDLADNVIFAVGFTDKFPYRFIRFLGYTGGIGSQIGNQTDRTISFDVHTFI